MEVTRVKIKRPVPKRTVVWREFPVGVEFIDNAKQVHTTFKLLSGTAEDVKNHTQKELAVMHLHLDHGLKRANISVVDCPDERFEEDLPPEKRIAAQVMLSIHRKLIEHVLAKVTDTAGWHVAGLDENAKRHLAEFGLNVRAPVSFEAYKSRVEEMRV